MFQLIFRSRVGGVSVSYKHFASKLGKIVQPVERFLRNFKKASSPFNIDFNVLGESKKAQAFGGLWNEKCVGDIQN